ncbi:MAG: T9SS type A sorting domain-containing protein, partial [Ignavibacteriales bacterium]|nr:T9SS type A sorting domain-containing protein [Ignavibacteriales bacterium]
TAPYKGADEYIAGVVPVELVLFTCELNGSNNVLNWKTATETNNYGFEVERLNNAVWKKIGFIKGKGTSSIGCDYRFTDEQIANGSVQYRLKQVDFSGTYTYSPTVEANRSSSVCFDLKQNFPNPFNPSTEIHYTLPFAGNVTVTVYNAVGEMVKLLDSGIKESGSYSLHFNGSELASGIYMYSIHAVSFDGKQNLKATKKMLLVK